MARIKETVTFTCMVMIEDGKGNVVVQNRVDPEWHGLVFPGGHVEHQEAFTDSAAREAFEETGLTVTDLRLVGLQQFAETDGYRYVALFYRGSAAGGELVSSEEGEVVWMPLEELLARKDEMCPMFDTILKIFLNEEYSEYCLVQSKDDPDRWDESLK